MLNTFLPVSSLRVICAFTCTSQTTPGCMSARMQHDLAPNCETCAVLCCLQAAGGASGAGSRRNKLELLSAVVVRLPYIQTGRSSFIHMVLHSNRMQYQHPNNHCYGI